MSGEAGGGTTTPAVFGHTLWFRWVLANAVGWGIGGIAGRIAAALIGTTVALIWGTTATALKHGGGPGSLLFDLLAAAAVVVAIAAGGAVAGAVVGIMQSRIVGAHLRSPIHWVAATIEGTAVGVLVGVAVAPFVGPGFQFGEPMHRALSQSFMARVATHGAHVLAWTITGGAIGLFVGIAQRSVFSRERGRASWTVANLVGWGLAGLVAAVSATPATLNQGFASGWDLQRILDHLAGLLIFGLVGGAVGGGVTGTVLVAAAPNVGQVNAAGGERRS